MVGVDMKDYKTVREIAEELGVSKQAVRNKIAKLGLQSSLRKNANQLCIDKKQENVIKSAFNTNQSQTKNANQSQTKNANFAVGNDVTLQLIEMLKAELEVKNKQLETKDKQIEELNKRLSEAHQLTTQAQQIHVSDKLLEIQEQVADPVEQEATQTEKQKGFFNKLFNK